MSAEYRKTTRPAPIRTSPSTTILPRWLARLRFGRIDPSDTSGSSRLCAHRMRRVRIKSIRESKHRTRGSFGPAPRLEVVAPPDALPLGFLAHRLEAHLPPDAAHLHPAERRGGIDELVRVDPHHPGSELRRQSVGAPQVLRPEAGAEAVRHPLRDRNRLLLFGARGYRAEPPQNPLLADPHPRVLRPHEGGK